MPPLKKRLPNSQSLTSHGTRSGGFVPPQLENVSEASTMPGSQSTNSEDATANVRFHAITPSNESIAAYLDESDEVESCSSFSLQECINEFRARRVRRTSGQGRENQQSMPPPSLPTRSAGSWITCFDSVDIENAAVDPADADLINQNRSNKEQERKCKPCQNGFCYCFTSDSGDNGCGAATSARGSHVRHSRRHNKRSECNPPNCAASQQTQLTPTKSKEQPCKHAPAHKQSLKSARNFNTPKDAESEQITAVSRLEEATAIDAPLIHIIQELHNNCVISEVRVNKHKIQQGSLGNEPLTAKTEFSSPKKTHFQLDFGKQTPTAPPIEVLTSDGMVDEEQTKQETEENVEEAADHEITYSSLDTSNKSDQSAKRRRHKQAGRLLQKRLSLTSAQLKPHKFDQPPPKPPRSSVGGPTRKSSVSTFASTTTSVREAEKILDDFLRRRGYPVPGEDKKQSKSQRNERPYRDGNSNLKNSKEHDKKIERKSYQFTQPDGKKSLRYKVLPTCPSLSDIERDVSSKNNGNYGKNIRRSTVHDKYEQKEFTLGWAEPKLSDVRNYDKNANPKEYRSQGTQAGPQAVMGWQVPPKVNLDMVDGAERQNLASNVEIKNTPVKSNAFEPDNQKWTHQFQKLSPWANKTNNPGAGGFKLKSSLKSSSRAFINNSKKKILRLVSPKKDNKVERARKMKRRAPMALRTVGVQTTHRNRFAHYEHSAMSPSPPGSYHSPGPVPTSTDTTPNNNEHNEPEFDFARTVRSPEMRKTPRPLPRRLNFPSCGDTCGGEGGSTQRTTTRTYHSFKSDLDHDMALSKMGCLLGNIRAKLEASDDRAVRTFEEIRHRERSVSGLDTPDSHCLERQTRTRAVLHNEHVLETRIQRSQHHNLDKHDQEPIYSEIEEDSIHISGSPHPQYDNTMGTPLDPQALYAKVNKPLKKSVQLQPTSLGEVLHNSLKNVCMAPTIPMPPVPEPSDGSDVSYTHKYSLPPFLPLSSPTPKTTKTIATNTSPQYFSPTRRSSTLSHCLSLNNIRVMEHNSPPKKNRNLSKSDLSLQRSDIFLENLCVREIIVEPTGAAPLGKVDNDKLNQSFESTADSQAPDVSYELPQTDDVDSIAAGSHLGSVDSIPLHANNQSTPKKGAAKSQAQTFTTKHKQNDEIEQQMSPEILRCQSMSFNEDCLSSPNVPAELSIDTLAPKRQKLDEDEIILPSSTNVDEGEENIEPDEEEKRSLVVKTWKHYKRFERALCRSFKKSKSFLKQETQRLTRSFNGHSPNSSFSTINSSCTRSEAAQDSLNSSFNLEALFEVDDDTPVTEQLAKAVSICRQLPELEISTEMVEAERLLLFSTLRSKVLQQQHPLSLVVSPRNLQPRGRLFYIDSLDLPVRLNPSQDLFFNHYYIVTFESNGVITSTQSAECHKEAAIFKDCGIEFVCGMEVDKEPEVRCNIFMLRLRKVSTLSLEPQKQITWPNLFSNSSSSSCEEIVSRFRLQASFKMHAKDFLPFEYVECESKNTNQICLRASNSCKLPLVLCTKSSNLLGPILVKARVEARFPKVSFNGFLNVQDPHTLHCWNRRWCTLDGLHLRVWQDESEDPQHQLFCLDLRDNLQSKPLNTVPRELCARPRCFCLQCKISKADEPVDTAAVFFTADTQEELNNWLLQLNAVLDFISTWMQ